MSIEKDLIVFLESNFNFDINTIDDLPDSESAFLKALQLQLSERIKHMIKFNMDSLMQALYRIDVNDRLSDEAFNLGEINQVSLKLAELIIIRQLHKLDYSRKFHGLS